MQAATLALASQWQTGTHVEPDGALVLLIDSDELHCVRLTALLRDAGYVVESTPHHLALPLLRDGHAFDAVILCAAPRPSTLSAQDRLGEFVARYMTHVVPALLSRTVVLTTLPRNGGAFPGAAATLSEPVAEDELLLTLAGCLGQP